MTPKQHIALAGVIILGLGLFFVFGISNKKEAVGERPITPPERIMQSSSTTPIMNQAGDKKVVAVSTSLNPCIATSTHFSCFQTYYTNLVKQKGVDAGFVQLKKDYEINSYVRSQCHPLTHVIGHAGATLYPDVSEAFKHGDSVCWSGYYHGVMEQIVEDVGIDKVATELDNICSAIPGKNFYSFDYYNCVHGLGHGLMAVTNNELFQALKLCDNLSGVWEESSCYGGVFMENVIIDNKNDFTKYLKPSEPLYPCNAVDNKYKLSCYLMQTSYMLKVSGQDFNKVFALCRLSDPGYVETCFQSLGRDASGQSLSNGPATKAKCDLGADYSEKANCIMGAVKDFISYFHSDVQAKDLCKSLATDLQSVCFNTVESYYKSF